MSWHILWQVTSLISVCLFTILPVYKVRFTTDPKGSQKLSTSSAHAYAVYIAVFSSVLALVGVLVKL